MYNKLDIWRSIAAIQNVIEKNASHVAFARQMSEGSLILPQVRLILERWRRWQRRLDAEIAS